MKSDKDALLKLRHRIAHAPASPGVYRWLDADGTVLYVGKAKHLRNRLRSYVLQTAARSPWTAMMIGQIADFDVTVTNTDLEALLLETNLIKRLKPKYNIMMKDDKNYVYVRISVQDPFPRIDIVRRMEEDGAKYFGPKTSAEQVRMTLSFLRTIFPFRTCRMGIEVDMRRETRDVRERGGADLKSQVSGLPLEVICHDRDRPTPCIDYHIKQCSAPCIGARTPERYRAESIDGVVAFFEGKFSDVEDRLRAAMQEAVRARKFERAAEIRDQLRTIRQTKEKQIVSDTSGENTDVIGAAVLSGRAHVVLLQEREGKLIGEESFALQGKSESVAEVLGQFLPQYYSEAADLPDHVVVGDEPEERASIEEWLSTLRGKRVTLVIPARGKKSQLLLLAEKNADAKARLSEAKWEAGGRRTEEALSELATLLRLPAIPKRIEGYDISHQGGAETVGSMVVFDDGKPKRDHYRSFNIRSVRSGDVDDYQALRETLKRRLKYLLEHIKREEQRWREQGIEVRRAHKDEQERIQNILAENEQSAVDADYREFLVAVHEHDLVAFGSMHGAGGGLLEFAALWVDETYRATALASFLARRLLKRVTKGKVYAVIDPSLEAQYADLGFRHVLTAPPLFQKRVARGTMIVMFDTKQHALDDSFTSRPDLLLIDGGKGQLSTAMQVLKEYGLNIPVAGLAKREEEIFIPGESAPLPVATDSPARFLLQRLRDEAHRFANDRRKRRAKRTAVRSELDGIDGIGETARAELLRRFGSVDAIRFASDEELRHVLTEAQVEALRECLS